MEGHPEVGNAHASTHSTLGPQRGYEHLQPPSHPAGYQFGRISCSWMPAGPVPAAENHLRCERLHAWSPRLSQYNLLCSVEDPSEIRPEIQSHPTQVSVIDRTCGIKSACDGVAQQILHKYVLFLAEFRRAAMGALENYGAICELFPELLNVGHICNPVKLFFLCELLDRAETHQITQLIRAKPEHRMAYMELYTYTASEAIKFRKLHCGHDLN
nr:hypothetical protein Iba_chr07aCG6680 [Ipomoea batatas]GMD12771.1 hypothetical protein Iba_chr07aCG6690 [Ipomoea batatas]